MSNTTSYHHIVIGTKYHRMSIPEDVCDEMYKILAAQAKKCGAYPIITNGIGNHVHMLLDFGPNTSRASLLQSMKQNSSIWARKSGKFPHWQGWSREYYCYSVSADRKFRVINYIKNQKTHHLVSGITDELRSMAKASGQEWYESNE